MSDRNLALTLAKVIIAAGWADGRMSPDEINSLKDLLYRLPQAQSGKGLELTGRDWTLLDMYIQSPIDSTERSRLVGELQHALRNPRDRKLALEGLEELIQADGEVTDNERAVVAEIRAALESVDLGIFAQIGRLMSGPLRRHSSVMHSREAYFEDFLKNKVYYTLRQRLGGDHNALAIPDGEVRKLSLAGGLMARVANIDHQVTNDEFEAIAAALEKHWGITHELAIFVTAIAISEESAGLDYFRLTQEFFNATTEDERARFLDILFAVANADGRVSIEENDEVRRITQSINLTQQHFAAAKDRMKAET
jgi:uncharacterized tellurite resistance protein B-like protein